MRCILLVSSPERNSAEHSCPVNHRPRMGTGTYEWYRAQLRDRKISIFESALTGVIKSVAGTSLKLELEGQEEESRGSLCGSSQAVFHHTLMARSILSAGVPF